MPKPTDFAERLARSFVVRLLLLSTGCAVPAGEADSSGVATADSEIIGGTVDTGDPQVFILVNEYLNKTQSVCSATLIGKQTLVTAAHCLPDTGLAGRWVTNVTDAHSVPSALAIRVAAAEKHPEWTSSSTYQYADVGLVLLAAPPAGVAPKPWNRTSVDGKEGAPLRAVGYGRTAATNSESLGVKNVVELTFREVKPDQFKLGDGLGKGICNGDSGGPSFHTFPDGVERLVGIHSYNVLSSNCTSGGDMRIDAFAPFVEDFLARYDSATCAHDGLCKPGCTADLDCLCPQDGVCSAACPDLGADPDCPKDCGANGVCAMDACPVPDPDCQAVGSACTSDSQCKERRCLSDPQHVGSYCSSGCGPSAPCPQGMECGADQLCRLPQLPSRKPGELCSATTTFCEEGTVCTGDLGAQTACLVACDSAHPCDSSSVCLAGQNGFRFCLTLEAPSVASAPAEDASAKEKLIAAREEASASVTGLSCSTSGGRPWSSWLVVAAMFAVVYGSRRRMAPWSPATNTVPPSVDQTAFKLPLKGE